MEKKLIVGTVQFGLDYGITNNSGKIKETEIDEIFTFCDDNNVLYFDTAQDYGTSEDILSKYSKLYPNVNVITKSKFGNKNIRETITKSLDKFDKIECYMLHSYNDYKNKDLLDELIYYKNKNKINRIGVSIYNVQEGIEILNDDIVDVIQLPFNYLDNQWFEQDFQNLLTKRNIEIHVRSIFLQGILLNRPVKYPINISQPEFDKLEEIIHELSIELQLNKLELCFAYINSFDWIKKFLIGVDNLHHMKSNYYLINKDLKLSSKQLDFVKKKTQDINKILIDPSKWVFN